MPDINFKFLKAARGGDIKQMVKCLEKGANVNYQNENGLNALHLASKDGHLGAVRDLLQRGVHADTVTMTGTTALHVSALAGQSAVVGELIRWHANINAQTTKGFTPLYMAAQEGNLETVKLLLANNADPHIDIEQFTPMFVARQQGHTEIAEYLEEHNLFGNKFNENTLHLYTEEERATKTDYPVKHRQGSKYTVTVHGTTALHVSALAGQSAVVGELIRWHANINAQTTKGFTPLYMAAQEGHLETVKLLLANNADPHIDIEQFTPIFVARQQGQTEIAEYLEEHNLFGNKFNENTLHLYTEEERATKTDYPVKHRQGSKCDIL